VPAEVISACAQYGAISSASLLKGNGEGITEVNGSLKLIIPLALTCEYTALQLYCMCAWWSVL